MYKNGSMALGLSEEHVQKPPVLAKIMRSKFVLLTPWRWKCDLVL